MGAETLPPDDGDNPMHEWMRDRWTPVRRTLPPVARVAVAIAAKVEPPRNRTTRAPVGPGCCPKCDSNRTRAFQRVTGAAAGQPWAMCLDCETKWRPGNNLRARVLPGTGVVVPAAA